MGCHRHHPWVNASHCHGGTETTPLLSAIGERDEELVEILLQAGLDLNMYDAVSSTPLLGAILHGDHALMKRLLDLGASPTMNVFRFQSCYNVLHQTGDTEAIDILLNYGVEVDGPCEYCPTALWKSVQTENHDRILHLASQGADVNSPNFEGENPLQYARRFHMDDIAELLERLGGIEANEKARRAAQISSVLRITSQFKLVSTEEPEWVSQRRRVMLGRCLFLLGDYDNSVIAIEGTFNIGQQGGIYPYVDCSGCRSRQSGRYHLCRDTGFGYCHARCLATHQKEINHVASMKDHVYVTFPRPFLRDCPAGFVALDQVTHITRNEWLDRVLAKWQPQTDTTNAMSAVRAEGEL
ncbi:uncharacterized protein PV07_12364 [Cladophialophora immunda]|uniref:Uncharacterized protein n=1 Tax=Cladophialophora immunda TaxID=569365 RepID=A0A0D2BVP0_9EURO|nr:uncharacterized protein PV07_12364 [Cladophialophora immunda]KIW22480.1 hypothetical protein PV07_12364 [Cladophialophora immunda]